MENCDELGTVNDSLSTIFDEDGSFCNDGLEWSGCSDTEQILFPNEHTSYREMISSPSTSAKIRDMHASINLTSTPSKKILKPFDNSLSMLSAYEELDEPTLHLYLSQSEFSVGHRSDDAGRGDSEIVNEEPTSSSTNRKRMKSDEHDRHNILNDLMSNCCPNDCLKLFTLQELEHCRDQLKYNKEHETRQFIMDTIKNQSNVTSIRMGTKCTLETMFIIQGKNVCPKGWCMAFNISNWRYNDCITQVKAGGVSAIRLRNSKTGLMRERTTTALAWMTVLFKRMGDYMPHRDIIQLPHSWTKRYLYDRMLSEQQKLHPSWFTPKSISYEHFTRIWKKHLPKYVISKVRIN